jgi:hypothetical protein
LDMLALCRKAAEREGLDPALYQQAFHELDLPRAYRTIYICDSFGIGGHREHDLEALRRCFHHLAPGGTLVFSHELPYQAIDQWPYWLPERRNELPNAWPASGMRERAADGDEIELRGRLVDLDPLEQRETRGMRALLWREGRLVAQEEHTIQITSYFRNELLLMLAQAGFTDIEVRAGYTEAPATAADTTVVFVAR